MDKILEIKAFCEIKMEIVYASLIMNSRGAHVHPRRELVSGIHA